MGIAELLLLGLLAGGGAGLLAGLVGIGGGIVIVPAVYYGLIHSGFSPDEAAHVAVSTSLATILPAAITSSIAHWRAGNTDIDFLRQWGPGIILGVTLAQFVAPHVRGSFLIAVFACFCLLTAFRFAVPGKFRPLFDQPPSGVGCNGAGLAIGLVSGFAGVGGGIMTNIVMTICGIPIHKSIGRAAVCGVLVGLPATIIAAFGPSPADALQLGSINIPLWICIAPVQACTAWLGAQLAQHTSAVVLSRIFACSLATTGIVMLNSSL
jgi:uncharacterized membrane protein YfcA